MIDVADVGLVDAHAEGDRRDDDVAGRCRPPLLGRDSVLRGQAGVIRAGGETGGSEQRGDAQGRPLKRHVHDRRPGRALPEAIDQQLLSLAGPSRRRQQRQVGAVEAGDDGLLGGDAEAGADVGHHGRRGGRRERQHALGPELARPRSQLEVVRPEVVPPLGDAVRLVDREQRDRRLGQLGEEALVVEPLGCDVEELQAAGAEAVGDVACLGLLDARIEPRCIDALEHERVDLILHQRDQRRDDDGDAVEHQGGELIAEALPGSGGEHRERGAAGEERLDDALLARSEGAEAEPGLEHLAGRRCLRCSVVSI